MEHSTHIMIGLDHYFRPARVPRDTPHNGFRKSRIGMVIQGTVWHHSGRGSLDGGRQAVDINRWTGRILYAQQHDVVALLIDEVPKEPGKATDEPQLRRQVSLLLSYGTVGR